MWCRSDVLLQSSIKYSKICRKHSINFIPKSGSILNWSKSSLLPSKISLKTFKIALSNRISENWYEKVHSRASRRKNREANTDLNGIQCVPFKSGFASLCSSFATFAILRPTLLSGRGMFTTANVCVHWATIRARQNSIDSGEGWPHL